MNRKLLDPFHSIELPEVIEEFLDEGVSRCIAFNRRGTLLAAGCADGAIVIWDCETRGVAQKCVPHSAAVTSVAWSKDGRLLLSGSLDKTICLWNLEQNKQECQVLLEGSVVQVSLCTSSSPSRCIVSFAVGPPVMVELPTVAVKPLPALVMEGDGKGSKPAGGGVVTASAVFDKTGSLIFIGQSKGTITVVDAISLRFVDMIKVPGGSRIVSLTLNRKGTRLLVNCFDRTVRLYEVSQPGKRRRSYNAADLKAKLAASKAPKQGSAVLSEDATLKLLREFRNEIERWQWRAVAFSNDDEHIVGVTDAKNEHIMYIWNAVAGNLTRILEGPKEGALDLLWHPLRSCLASVSTVGKVYLWAPVYRENWSAFAPDFEELEENREYVEREDEFDTNEREEDRIAASAAAAAPDAAGDDTEVDIMTMEDEPVFSSDEEDAHGSLHYLPVHLEKPEPKAVVQARGGSADISGEEGPAVRLGDAALDSAPSGVTSAAGQEGLTTSQSGQYDSTGNEEGAARGRKVKLKIRLSDPAAKREDDNDSSTGHQETRLPPVSKKKRRR